MFTNFISYLSSLLRFNVDIETVLSMLNSAQATLQYKDCYISVLPKRVAELKSNKMIFVYYYIKNTEYCLTAIKDTATRLEIKKELRLASYSKKRGTYWFVKFGDFIQASPHPCNNKNSLLLELKTQTLTIYKHLSQNERDHVNSVVFIPQNLIGLVNRKDKQLIDIKVVSESYFYALFHSSLPGGQYMLDEKIGYHMHEIKKLLN